VYHPAGVLPIDGMFADRYRLEREIGAGGMATVYLAEDLRHRRKVAIKVLRAEVSAALGPGRFLTEIELTAALQHPHILPLYDSGDTFAGQDRLLFYVMPYVSGESLRRTLARQGQLPVQTAVRLLRDIADALSYAHDQGIVHRDIKPENVLVTERHALVADFGIAKALAAARNPPPVVGGDETTALVTAAGAILGTPAYMSPEQATGERTVDHRSDIYSFGVLAYELLTGQTPFAASSTPGLIAAHLATPAPTLASRRPDAGATLELLVSRCLEKDPDQRWQNASELVTRLEAVVSVENAARSKPTRIRLIAVAAILTIVGAVALWNWRPNPDPPLRVAFVTALTTAPGLEIDPALSPDGRLLAYAAGPPGRTRIYVRQIADGGRDVPLTTDDGPMNQRWPQWSPDSQRILFQAGFNERYGRSSPSEMRGTIYVAPALGGTARALVQPGPDSDAFAPSWAPDGTRVVFVRSGAAYGDSERITAAAAVSLSGGRICPTVVPGWRVHRLLGGQCAIPVRYDPPRQCGTGRHLDRRGRDG
jgi:serine/threonine-protein kinase